MTDFILNRIRWFLFAVIIMLVTASCEKEYKSKIPEVYVNINVAVASYIDLNVPGNYIYFPQAGFAGVILFCDDVGAYSAYDAACTHDVSTDCSLLEEGAIEGVTATCPCCGSKYILFGGGYVINGPAVEPLKQYHVQVLDGGGRIRIYN